MNATMGTAQPPNLDPFARPKKDWRLTIILVSCILGLCTLVICISVILNWRKTSSASTTYTYHYRLASLDLMVTSCSADYYKEPQPWMTLVSGSDDVLVISYSQPSIFVDAYYSYDLYIQVDPDRLVAGEVLTIPSLEVPAALIETRAPLIYCDTELSGSFTIREVTSAGAVRAQVELIRTAPGPEWSFSGEVEFTNPPLP